MPGRFSKIFHRRPPATEAVKTGLIELASARGPTTIDVVAVHGLQGHPYNTWAHENGFLWLRDYLPAELPSARIMSFGYDSTVAFSKSVAKIEDIALNLLNQLSLKRQNRTIPIVFIGHSLGGILIKKLLILAHEHDNDSDFQDILNKTRAVSFLGVPHKGSGSAWWGNFAANALKAASVGTSTNTSLVADLRRDSTALIDISNQFMPRGKDLIIYTFYETQKFAGEVIVDKPSAQIGVPNEKLFSVEADHRNICKFPSLESVNSRGVGPYIVKLVSEVAAIPQTVAVDATHETAVGEVSAGTVHQIPMTGELLESEQSRKDFYLSFFWAVSELHHHFTNICSDHISETLESATFCSGKTQRSKMEDRLGLYLGSDAAVLKFVDVAKRVVHLLAQLLSDPENAIPTESTNKKALYRKLQCFAKDLESQDLSLTSAERFKIPSRSEHQSRCIQQFTLWNRWLQGLIRNAQTQLQRTPLRASTQPHSTRDKLIYSIRNPSAQVCRLTRSLYTGLSNCWSCDCTVVHEAKFCLNLHAARQAISADLNFDFVVSAQKKSKDSFVWQEGTVIVRSEIQPRENEGSQLNLICDALGTCPRDYSLRLLMEDANDQQSLWQLNPIPRQIRFLEAEPPVSLQDLLFRAKMGPVEKRELALICTYSLLLFHGSPWLSHGWGKSALSFFYKLDGDPDYRRPFLSTRFEDPVRELGGHAGSEVFHRNSNILALGILLIEIFNEKPIESWRNPAESATVTPSTEANTNFMVATRVVRKMESSPSRSAIEACLMIDWVSAGRKVRLKDLDTRVGFYDNVIEPIQEEMEWISQRR